GSGEQVVVEFTSLDSLQDVANRINEQVTGARAELIDTGNGFQLSVSSQETGTANALTFTEGGSSLGFLAQDSVAVEAQDATFTMNGIPITRSSNTVGDLLTGVTLELRGTHAAADADTSVSVTSDPSGTEAKVKTLVDAFNALADAVSAQTSYNGVARGQDTLFGDSTVRALQRSLSQMAGMNFPHGEGEISLNDVGVQLARTGRLNIDSAKLAEAIGDDPAALEDLIAGPAGLASAMADMVTQFTRSGDGFLSAKSSSLTREMSDYDLQIERIETRASKVGDQLRAQFTALEALMSSFQSQQASLAMLFR
ncbi:MAG TPA: flagellar filament capping protein FliD, partial [Kofleriaceae bacterium]|nr:flagellar filament capping protein FliD [Kofleriaceae bacterium]